MKNSFTKLVAGCVVGVTLGMAAMSSQAAQATASPFSGNNWSATNIVLNIPCRINWIAVTETAGTNSSISFIDSYTNSTTYTIAGTTNVVTGYYTTNLIYTWTNSAAVTQTNYGYATVMYSKTNSVNNTTGKFPVLATFTALASSTTVWTNSAGLVNVFGLVISTNIGASQYSVTVDYSPIH